MKRTNPRRAEYIYDMARRELGSTGGLFKTKMLHPLFQGVPVSGAWTGSGPITAWEIRRMPNFGDAFVHIKYDTGHVVNVPVESDEELQRLAQVFADLINSQYYS